MMIIWERRITTAGILVVRWIDPGATPTTPRPDGSTATCPPVCGIETARSEMEPTTEALSALPDTAETARTGTATSPTLTDGTAPPTLTGESEIITTAGTPVERGQHGVIPQICSTGGRCAGSPPS